MPPTGHDHDGHAGQVAIEEVQSAVETQPVAVQAEPAQDTLPTPPVDVGDPPQVPEAGPA